MLMEQPRSGKNMQTFGIKPDRQSRRHSGKSIITPAFVQNLRILIGSPGNPKNMFFIIPLLVFCIHEFTPTPPLEPAPEAKLRGPHPAGGALSV